jgi:uncharacterized protein (TIGR00255 family)
MIRSMTGFGRSSMKTPYGEIAAEIKTLNHKSLSVTCNPLNGFFLLEERLKKVFEGRLFRGKVFVRITRESVPGQKSLQKIRVNEGIAREYVKKIKKVQKDLALGGDVQIRDIIGFPGVMETSVGSGEEDKLWPHIRKVLDDALDNLMKFREKEGKRLAKDFKARLRKIRENLREIKKREKQTVVEFRKNLQNTIREVAKEAEPDRGRLEEEVALFAKNCDIAEEITRLEGHIEEYMDLIDNTETDIGKKLDFMAQEMQREANTIGAKSGDFNISKAVIEIKTEIEKIREQIRNIE